MPIGTSKCPVYVRFPWIGSASQLIANKLTSSVARCYNAVKVQNIFRFVYKDVRPIFQLSNLICRFQCCCDATYIGRTSQCLEKRVKQHVPRGIRNRTTFRHSQMLDFAICKHLNTTNTCAVNNNDECVAALHRAMTFFLSPLFYSFCLHLWLLNLLRLYH